MKLYVCYERKIHEDIFLLSLGSAEIYYLTRHFTNGGFHWRSCIYIYTDQASVQANMDRNFGFVSKIKYINATDILIKTSQSTNTLHHKNKQINKKEKAA